MKVDMSKVTTVHILDYEGKLKCKVNKIYSMTTVKYKDGEFVLVIKEF